MMLAWWDFMSTSCPYGAAGAGASAGAGVSAGADGDIGRSGDGILLFAAKL